MTTELERQVGDLTVEVAKLCTILRERCPVCTGRLNRLEKIVSGIFLTILGGVIAVLMRR